MLLTDPTDAPSTVAGQADAHAAAGGGAPLRALGLEVRARWAVVGTSFSNATMVIHG